MIDLKPRSRITNRRCPECIGKLIKFGGYEYQDRTGMSVSFIVGRVCKRCNILYIDPRFKSHKVILHKIGGNNEKKSL